MTLISISFFFARNYFRNFYPRKFAYLVASPLLAGLLIASLITNSYPYFFLASFSFFFTIDAIGIPAPDIITDISRFYFLPKGLGSIFFNYILYRLITGFVISFLPAFFVFAFATRALPEEVTHLPLTTCFLVFLLAWLFFVIASIPMLILAFRKQIFYRFYSFFSFPFYSIPLIVQLEFAFKMNILNNFLHIVLIGIGIMLLIIGISFKLLLKNEILYPEKRPEKLGY